jgi:hypothetical protein
MDGRLDGRTDGQTEERKEGREGEDEIQRIEGWKEGR